MSTKESAMCDFGSKKRAKYIFPFDIWTRRIHQI